MPEKVPWTIRDATKVVLLTVFSPLYLLLLVPAYLFPSAKSELHQLFANPIVANAAAEGLFVATEALLLGWVLRKYGATLKDFGVRSFRLGKALLYVIGFYVLLGIVVAAVFGLVQHFAPAVNLNQPQANGFDFGKAGIGLWASFFVTVIVAPITEEIYFRGFLFPAFKRYGAVMAALLSSLVFGIVHFQLNVSIYTFLLGLFLCFMYQRLKSIWPGVGLHMLNNFIAFWVLLSLR